MPQPIRKKHCLSLNATTISTIQKGAKKTFLRTDTAFLERCIMWGRAKVEARYPNDGTKRPPAISETPVTFIRRINTEDWSLAKKSRAKTNLTSMSGYVRECVRLAHKTVEKKYAKELK